MKLCIQLFYRHTNISWFVEFSNSAKKCKKEKVLELRGRKSESINTSFNIDESKMSAVIHSIHILRQDHMRQLVMLAAQSNSYH